MNNVCNILIFYQFIFMETLKAKLSFNFSHGTVFIVLIDIEESKKMKEVALDLTLSHYSNEQDQVWQYRDSQLKTCYS